MTHQFSRWTSDNLEPVTRDTWSAASAVPSWVHMAEVPPTADEEPWAAAPEDARCRHAGGWALLCCVVFLLGVAIGHAAGGVR